MSSFEFQPLKILSCEKDFVVEENMNKWKIRFESEGMDCVKTIIFDPLIKGNVVEWFCFLFYVL
jgi:hypothetical protein